MRNGSGFEKWGEIVPSSIRPVGTPLHPVWSTFMKYCAELQHGEIEILKIQDGLPILAEITRKKVKFMP